MKPPWLVLLVACSEPTTAIDLELLPNPELNSEQDLAARVRTIVVVIDAAEGPLYPLEDEQLGGALQIKNADADATDLELVATVDVPADRLPEIRIERGGLPDIPLYVRVLGSVDGGPGAEIARGGLPSVTFAAGSIKRVPTPFNLLPRYLPLRVSEVAPGDGQLIPCDVQLEILTVFSRSPAGTSVTTPGRVLLSELGGEDVAAQSLEVALSTMRFVPSRTVTDYRLVISTEVTDTDGGPLDQVPSMAGLQPFAQDFHLECSTVMSPTMARCSAQAPTAPCPGGDRFRCDRGTCVPARCEGASCTAGFVCDPSTLACEVDCRPYGDDGCPVARPRCTAAGYCE